MNGLTAHVLQEERNSGLHSSGNQGNDLVELGQFVNLVETATNMGAAVKTIAEDIQQVANSRVCGIWKFVGCLQGWQTAKVELTLF
ncbi:MAG: hypothetical protein HQL69_21340 [Magnetococcales bacterium]|nr:hypothetical protein [Magnetococcales bacterium]